MDASAGDAGPSPAASPRQAAFSIDLNEMPSPPPPEPPQPGETRQTVTALPASSSPAPSIFLNPQEAYTVALRYHAVVPSTGEPPAEFPGEAGTDDPPLPCGACGLPEVRDATLVCDGCERGFHLSCVQSRSGQLTQSDDWLCTECTASGQPKKRWTLGAARLLDINALPPEADEMEEPHSSSRGTSAQSMDQPKSTLNVGKEADMDALRAVAEDGMMYGRVHGGSQHCSIKASYTDNEVDERNDHSGIVRSKPLPRRKKYLRGRKKYLSGTSAVASLPDCQDYGRAYAEPYCDVESAEPQSSSVRGTSRASRPRREENTGKEQDLQRLLPLQYEDFYIVHLGKIDMRSAYHDINHIWPVGYKAIWHDKLTGSVFESDVSDGGNDGPVFTVRRYPCSAFAIPNGVTVISYNSSKRSECAEQSESSSVIFGVGTETENEILTLLSDPSQSDQDFFSCISSKDGNSVESPMPMNVHEQHVSMDHVGRRAEKFGQALDATSVSRDEIGEFYVEGRSSSSVWQMVSQTFNDACYDLYRRSGSLKFCCSHESKVLSSSLSKGTEKGVDHLCPLARFCCFPGPSSTARVIQSDSELESSCKLLAEWLKEDRFGLNMDFVQEIIENLPGSHCCSGYHTLVNRVHFPKSLTVANGRLIAIQTKGHKGKDQVIAYGLHKRKTRFQLQEFGPDHYLYDHQPPPGKALSSKLPSALLGDVIEIWVFLWRFYELLGLKKPPSFEELEEELIDPWPISSNMEQLEKDIQYFRDNTQSNDNPHLRPSMSSGGPDLTASESSPFNFVPTETASIREAAQDKLASCTYGRSNGVILTKIHISLLKVLIGDLLCKVAGPTNDSRESRSRRKRKKDSGNSLPLKEIKNDILTANELTWPELARRCVLSTIFMNGGMDSSDGFSRERMKLFRCLQGDGGVLCGSLSGVASMEADVLLLAEAERQISDCRKQQRMILLVDNKDSDAVCTSEPAVVDAVSLPDWAKPLQPVKKLPTNVGTRIRKCIYEALDKKPPEWARKILEHSISKQVYKGNASGPTKKAALSVLAEASGGRQPQKPVKKREEKSYISLSDAIMKKCRLVLRHVVLADEEKAFCNLLGCVIANVNNDEDEGILGLPGMVSRPMDFRTIDLRLAAGAYCGSYEAFYDDVQEVWRNLSIVYGERSDYMELVKTLSREFESLYKSEVLSLAQKVAALENSEPLDLEKQKDLQDLISKANDIPKAPWEEGVCKVCGIDKDDDSVLLCDTCDSEYHSYCLIPPLARIPEGNWYCPSCIRGQLKTRNNLQSQVTKRQSKKYSGQEPLSQLAIAMEEREYWEFSAEERIVLLKFLCDEVLNAELIREHLEQCSDKPNKVQKRLRTLISDLGILKFKQGVLAEIAAKEKNKFNARVKDDGSMSAHSNYSGLTGYLQNGSSNLHSSSVASGSLLKRTSSVSVCCFDEGGQSDLSKNINPIHAQAHMSHTAANCHSIVDIVVPGNVFSETILEHGVTDRGTRGKESSIKNTLNTEKDPKKAINSETSNDPASSPDSGGIFKYDALSGSNALGANASGKLHTPIQERDSNSIANNAHNLSNETGTGGLDLGVLKNEISCLQDKIFNSDYQLMMSSLRRDFLGRDSFGRLYWSISRPGKRPLLFADGSMPLPNKTERNEPKRCRAIIFPDLDSSCSVSASDISRNRSSQFALYETDKEIEELVHWLLDIDPLERKLKDHIIQWKKLIYQLDILSASTDFEPGSKSCELRKYAAPISLASKAAMVLEARYGPFWEREECETPKKKGKKSKQTSEERMHRCYCLEPLWPSRLHCPSCHQTFSFDIEIEGHNEGKCTQSNPDQNQEYEDQPKGNGSKSDNMSTNHLFPRKSCPFDLNEMCKNFVMHNSNKEMVQEIGLIGSNGIPSFVPSPVAFKDIAFVINPTVSLNDDLAHTEGSLPMAVGSLSSSIGDAADTYTDGWLQGAKDSKCGAAKDEETSPIRNIVQQSGVSHGSMVPELSLRTLVGKTSEILKRLKINLLDMEAALPMEAVKPSKSHCTKRCAWRAFVKSAESIFEMVQAIILFEGMIKIEYLKNRWWYWSSKTAAAKTTTLTSLALRLYTLDDCIIYVKDEVSGSGPVDNLKPTHRKGKKRKVPYV